MRRAVRRPFLLSLVITIAIPAFGQDAWQVSGFALLRGGAAPDEGPLVSESLGGQVQVGIDWVPDPMYSAHIHLLGRSDHEDTLRGAAGVVEAYVDANFVPGGDRVRVRGGAFFLPTSRENVDALWEPAYTLTPSALNSWLGEEFRPIGIDTTYFRGRAIAGATVFRGNDTFGALPPVRGWRLTDHWITLGEWIAVDSQDFTSVSAETDGRLGWSARGAWNGDRLFVQLTHLDNRSDGRDYGRLFNWNTRFDIAAVEFTHEDWTVAGEYGWGPTYLVVNQGGTEERYVTDLAATYLLVSRSWPRGRITVRADWFDSIEREDEDEPGVEATGPKARQRALTAAFLWTPPGRVRPAIELTTSGGDRRVLLEVRYSFAAH